MFILEEPYVSDLMKKTLLEMKADVLENDVSRNAFEPGTMPLLPSEKAQALYQGSTVPKVYANSENAIDWVSQHLASSELDRANSLFKDKARFRDLVRDMYPEFFYREVQLADLKAVDVDELPMPCIIKPSVGFFSLGVHMVSSPQEWPQVVDAIASEVDHICTMYPSRVVSVDTFIIEECIEGEEFAVDAYYDDQGRPVIINIFSHAFSSSHDVSDRCYVTSTEIIRQHHDQFSALLAQIGDRAHLANYPVHMELRQDTDGNLGIIEVNPMRFAGWCVTDLAYYAYGINPYQCYMQGLRPDWDAILAQNPGNTYAMVIGDIDSSVDRSQIRSADYERFAALFPKVLQLRKIDFYQHPVFAFVFAELGKEETQAEIETLLRADFTEFLVM